MNIMLKRFVAMYGAPDVPDPAAFFGEFDKALKGMAHDVLDRATDIVIRERTSMSWPPPGVCVKACQAAAEQIAEERERMRPTRKFEPEIQETPEERVARCERANAIMAEFRKAMRHVSVGKTKEDSTGPFPDASRKAFENRPGWRPGPSLADLNRARPRAYKEDLT